VSESGKVEIDSSMRPGILALSLIKRRFEMANKQVGLYIHIPFCKAKCFYCDFNSYAYKDELVPAYFDALERELEITADIAKEYSIKSIFIGGGTPSYIKADYIYKTIKRCRDIFNIEPNAEISIESNPGTLTVEKLNAYKESGINRLSMGLQAWQNQILKRLGRIHDIDDFIKNYKEAEKVGFENINVDLIFGIPGQTLNEWLNTLSNVIRLGSRHLSCYSLKIEEGTVFDKRVKSGKMVPIDDDIDREMYHETIRILNSYGYNHYEISNFAREGYECRHNLIYWNAEEYLGFGAGAHSYVKGKRFNNEYSLERYIALLSEGKDFHENVEIITKEDSMSEYMILGLRLIKGIDKNEFKERFNEDIMALYQDKINKLIDEELLESINNNLRLTPKGLDLANRVFVEFI
jgi:oxygen-independent coproporphyrinogen III oxidase